VRIAGGPDGLARGDRVFAVVQLAPLELLFNAGLADPLPFAARRGVVLTGTALALEIEAPGRGPLAALDRFRAHVRRRILATFAPDARGMARALVLGENDLDPDDAAAFRKSGLSHMLAVSGTHLVFAVVSIVNALTALLVRIERLAAGRDVGRLSAALGIFIACVYADFAGGSGSAWRAAFMLSAAFTARALGRAPSVSRSLAFSVLLGWLADPRVAFDVSFLLSFAATAGLVLLGKPLARPCERMRSRVSRALGTGIATTLAAMIPCAPLLALLGADLTLAGVFANVIAAPLGETVALPLCLLHAILSGAPALESGVAMVASGALLLVRRIAHESANQGWLAFPLPDPNGYQLALCATLAVAITLARRSSTWQRIWTLGAALGIGVVELAVRAQGSPRGELRLTSLAVGQGDAALVDFPDGRLMLIDGGGAPSGGADPGERVVLPMLRARRRPRLDVVVLTHPHPDHFGGLLAVIRGVEVGEIWDSGQGQREGAGPVYAAILREARARGIPVRTPPELCGAARAFGAARVKLLAPCPAYAPNHGENDNSLVLRITLGARAFLLTGDAEAAAESELLARARPELAADVLKAGHHGSRTSTGEAFARRVAPAFAVLSCGARNRFGHPSPEVVERLARLGARAFRTDRDGSVGFRTDGARLEVSTARPPGSDGAVEDRSVSSAASWLPSLTPLLRRALLRWAPPRPAAQGLGLDP
jgi:competence protein ComEC